MLPIVLGTTYVVYVLFGVYRRAWRYATTRDLVSIVLASGIATLVAYGIVVATRNLGDFPREVFVVYGVTAAVLAGASRCFVRLVPEAGGGPDDGRRRVLVAGAGQAGRGLVRDLAARTTSSSSASSTTTRGFADAASRACRCSARSATRAPRSRRRAPTRSSSRSPTRRRSGWRCSAVPATRRVSPTVSCASARFRPRRHPSRRRVSADVSAAPLPRASATSDARARVEALAPLVGAYLLLATLYAWQAWRRETPTIFSDELETTQISRAIAETGHAARRGEPYGFTSLVPWLTAPLWWLHPVATAYEAIKSVQAFVMAAAIFPAFLLARRVLSPAWAYFAAVAAIAGPALSYSPILVEEPWAYPASTVALWLTVRAVDRPGRWPVALAFGSCLLAVLVRSQLVALFGTLAFAMLVLCWRTTAMRRWRATWSRWDWVGAVVLGVGAVIAVVAFLGHRSNEWSTATTLWKGRMVEYGSWAGGAFAIGIGVLPAIALLAMLGVPRSERERPGVRAFVVVAGGAVVSFGWYAAIKGAYLSTTFSSLIVERNLVYLAPLAFVATAYLFERAAAPVWSVVVAGAAVLGLIVWVPIERGLDNFPYYEAHGLAILALANREWAWPLGRIETAVEVLTVGCVVLLLLVGTRLRSHLTGIAAPVAVGAAVALLVWNVTAEVYASIGEHDFSALVERNIPKPNDWIDRAAGGGSVVMLGQHMSDDPLGVPSTEFWNRSIGKVWSVDGSGPGPGHTLTPDLQDVDGTLWPNPESDFVVASGGVEVVGEQVASNAGSSLVRLDGKPDPARSNETGIAGDGWVIGDPGTRRPGACGVQPLRRLRRRHGDGGGDAVAPDVLPRRACGCRGTRSCGSACSGAARQAARDRAADGLGVALRPCLRRADGRAADAERPVARRGRDRNVRAGEGRPEGLASAARRAPSAAARSRFARDNACVK